MAAPTLVGSVVTTQEFNNVTSYTATLPASPVTGNLLVAFVCSTAGDLAGSLWSMTGWTKIGELGNTGPNASECMIAAFYREVTGSETSTYEMVKTGSAGTGVTAVVEINGASDSTPINQSLFGETTAGSQSSFAALQVTTDVDDCYVLAAFAADDGRDGPFSISGTGWTERAEDSSGPDLFDGNLIVADKTMSGQGGTGTCTCTPTANTEAAWAQVAIAPAAAGGSSIPILQNHYKQQHEQN